MMIVYWFILPVLVHGQWLLLEEDGPEMLTTESDAKIPPRHGCGAWCVGDDVYIFGGSDETTVLDDFWKYETENRRWIWMPDPPSILKGLTEFAYWTIQDDIYLYGGTTQLHGVQNSMWKYEPTLRKWSLIQSTGTPSSGRRSMAFWTHKPTNQLYMYGGDDGNMTYSDMWTFNIVTETWLQLEFTGAAPIHTEQRSYRAVLGKSEDTVYYFTDRLYQLDIPTLTWSISPINNVHPLQREGYSMFMSYTQDKISLFSGHMGAKLYADYWFYDPEIEEWIDTEKSNGPSARWGSCGCTDNRGDYYMFGGTFEDPKHFHNDLWKNGPLTAKNIFQLLDFKLDSVTLSSLVAAAMSTILVCILFLALLCVCVKKCRRERHLLQSYKAEQGSNSMDSVVTL